MDQDLGGLHQPSLRLDPRQYLPQSLYRHKWAGLPERYLTQLITSQWPGPFHNQTAYETWTGLAWLCLSSHHWTEVLGQGSPLIPKSNTL